MDSLVFVFGSNLAGRHGAGAALTARSMYGARYGQGEGRQGMSYAIPTKNEHLRTLPLERIEKHVRAFLAYAEAHPETRFLVTRVGCGRAGYSDADMASRFRNAPANCILPVQWRTFATVATFHDEGRILWGLEASLQDEAESACALHGPKTWRRLVRAGRVVEEFTCLSCSPAAAQGIVNPLLQYTGPHEQGGCA